MKRPLFINNYFYHIFNRGVEKRNIFLDNEDFRRFLFEINEFNDINSTINTLRRFNEGSPTSFKMIDKEPLVKIASYCLMPNHFHFILEQLKENGISKFLQKIGTGYTNYFNRKYERSGVLFQGKFKAVLIDKSAYITYLIQYIHLNPLDLIEPDWKEKGLRNYRRAKDFLKSYKWTDCDDYDKYGEVLREYHIENFAEIKNFIFE